MYGASLLVTGLAREGLCTDGDEGNTKWGV